jgi:hypothetical protein
MMAAIRLNAVFVLDASRAVSKQGLSQPDLPSHSALSTSTYKTKKERTRSRSSAIPPWWMDPGTKGRVNTAECLSKPTRMLERVRTHNARAYPFSSYFQLLQGRQFHCSSLFRGSPIVCPWAQKIYCRLPTLS